MNIPIQFQLFSVIILILLNKKTVNCYRYSKSSSDFPPLYTFDDYDSCLNNKNSKFGSTYCMIYAEIKPQNNSELWQKIEEHTDQYKFHYRRDHLFMGVCMEHCKQFQKLQQNFVTHKVEILKNEVTEYFDSVHKRPLDLQMRSEYQDLIYNCLNYEFQENYGLGLRTYIEYCESPDEIKEEKDPLEKTFYKILQIILILNILSTLYDFCLKRKQPEENQDNVFYKINPQQPVSRLLTSFSIRRNYYRLVQPYHSEVGQDLSFLDGFRSVCMLICVSGHTFFIQYQHIKNPEFYENVTENPKMFLGFNATQIIEIFFVMSGLLLYIKFECCNINQWTSIRDCVKTFIKGMLFRYTRFLPSVGFFMLINATIYPRLQDGPFWRHVTETNRVFLREKWWKSLFMFNNINPKESAYFHTWYLGTDCQLFAFYFMILILIAKYPKYKKTVLSSLAVLSFVIPFLISYALNLEPSFMVSPECYRYSFFKDAQVFYKIYTKFYTNLGGYLFGIICGELYLKYARKYDFRQEFCGKLRYELALWIMAPVAYLIMSYGSALNLKEPSIWSALYAGSHRNLWILFVCGAPLISMMCKLGLWAYEFCCLPVFRFLGRLSFQIYLWHFSILYLITAYQRQPIYSNYFYIYTQFVMVFGLSMFLAFIIVIFVEYPFAQIVQIMHSKRSTKDKKQT